MGLQAFCWDWCVACCINRVFEVQASDSCFHFAVLYPKRRFQSIKSLKEQSEPTYQMKYER